MAIVFSIPPVIDSYKLSEMQYWQNVWSLSVEVNRKHPIFQKWPLIDGVMEALNHYESM
jgi:hypothetical protein